jgi:hypothetical protein
MRGAGLALLAALVVLVLAPAAPAAPPTAPVYDGQGRLVETPLAPVAVKPSLTEAKATA